MKTPCLILAMALGLVLFTGCDKAAEGNGMGPAHHHPKGAAAKAQTTCPVMGGAINQEIHADHKGKRVYFCCGMCPGTFKKNPEKYLKKMAAENIVPETLPKATKAGKAQTTCPVMGGAINQEIHADHKGKRVYFCCDMCVGTFKKDPEHYLKVMAAKKIVVETLP